MSKNYRAKPIIEFFYIIFFYKSCKLNHIVKQKVKYSRKAKYKSKI